MIPSQLPQIGKQNSVSTNIKGVSRQNSIHGSQQVQNIPLGVALTQSTAGPSPSTAQYQLLAKKSREAMPILRREKHLFKIVTIYVVDKYNFNLQKLQRFRETQREEIQARSLERFSRREFEQKRDSPVEKDSIIDQRIDSPSQKMADSSNQELTGLYRRSLLSIPQFVQISRGSSAPTKGLHPSHFKHGERAHKHCIVCEGYAKTQQNEKGSGPKDTTLKEQHLKDLKHAVGGHHEGQRGGAGEQDINSDRKISLKKEDSVRHYGAGLQEGGALSTKPTFSIDGGNSIAGNSPRHHKINVSPESKKDLMDRNQKLEGSVFQDDNINPIQGTNENLQHQALNPSQPTKRDGDIEEFQRRSIQLDDFLQGGPNLKLMFSKHVRKFNRELLKATCLVIGCKRMYANKISEKVFDEFDFILNDLSDSISFDDHFQIDRVNDPSVEEKDGNKHFITVTISAPLFKYVLKKYLVEKYKYSRPEYLKDFYVASDLVQSKRNILILLAGTSGTGKSTLASLLGSRLGISTVLSTDTIRHVMRNFVAKEEDPIIFASTYETAAFAELEKVIDDFQKRNESLVVEGVHLTVRFMLNMMKKYPSCIPFIICITNEDKHKERFAVRTKHMTIDPKFNKYIKNVASIRIIQKHIIKKAEAALIPRIDNSNIDKSIGLIHATIVRCLRQIAEGTPIFDVQRKQAMLMHQEFANISKNKLSSKDAQKFIHQKVNKKEILDNFLKQQANTELEDKLKRYKRGQSMGQMTSGKPKTKKTNSEKQQNDNSNHSSHLHENTPTIIQMLNNASQSHAGDLCSEDGSPKAKTIHVIMRPDPEGSSKLTEIERKNIKKQFINVFQDFPEDEEAFGDSKAAQLVAATGSKVQNSKQKAKKEKPDVEETRIRDEKKRQSDQQKKIEEEKIQSAIIEAQKKEKEELERIEAETKLEKEKLEKEKMEKEMQEIHERMQAQLLIAPKSQSLVIQGTQKNVLDDDDKEGKGQNLSFEYLNEEDEYDPPLARKQSQVSEESKHTRQQAQNNSPSTIQTPINITNVKDQIKKESSIGSQPPIILTFVEDLDASAQLQQHLQVQNQNASLLRPHSNDEDDNDSNQAQPESRSMTSFEHLKQMEALDEFMGKRSDAVLSDIADDEEDSERQRINDNIQSASAVLDHGQRQNYLYPGNDKQKHDHVQKADKKNSPQKVGHGTHSKFKKQRPKDDVKSVEPPMQLSYHNIQNMKNINKSTERAGGGNDSSEGHSNSNENKSQDSKIKGLAGAGEKKQSFISKNVLGNPIGVRAFRSLAKKGPTKLKTQSSALLMKKAHKKSMLSNPQGHLLAVPGHPALGQSQVLNQQTVASTGLLDPQLMLKLKQGQESINQDDLQSIYSGGSGMAPSLVSGSINFFPQGNAVKTDEDNQSAANAGEKLQESGESSDSMNSNDAEASDRDVISEEEDVIMSHSSDSDHEEEHEDEIQKKQTSFNQPKASPLPQQLQSTGAPPSTSNFSPPKSEIQKTGSQEKTSSNGGTSQIGAFGNIGTEEAYDMIKTFSKKSFEEDNKPAQRAAVKDLELE